jgi:ATP-dependent DNA helicase PIF1
MIVKLLRLVFSRKPAQPARQVPSLGDRSSSLSALRPALPSAAGLSSSGTAPIQLVTTSSRLSTYLKKTIEVGATLTPVQEAAVRAAFGPDPVVFLTGRAGTGKSTIIQKLRTLENTVVCAPTGIAALNCRGATIHSTFKIPPRFLDPLHSNPKTVPGLNKIRLLVIDEISMVRADVLDYVNATLQYNRNSSEPFGGVKVLLVGDCRQLPPVVTEQERDAVKARYTSPWWFDAHCIKNVRLHVHELTHIHRQRDPSLIQLLDNVRHGTIDMEKLGELNSRCYRGPVAPDNALILTARRKDAETMNQMKLDAISGESKTYDATASGSFAEEKEMNVPSPRQLELKVGARVLVTKNHSSVVNGTLGTVTKLNEHAVQIRPDNGSEDITLTEASWEQYRYTLKDGQFVPEVVGTYKQIPLTYGWAVTIHKAQGLTLDSVCVDLGNGAFASGQTYVALSRTRTMDALSTRRRFNHTDFIAEHRVSEFHAQYGVH